MINSSVVGLGILLAAVSGLMNGTFTLPMRYLGRWSWENVWALFIVTSCLVMPLIMVLATVTNPLQLLSAASPHQEAIAVATGLAWGFGAIMFGQGVSAVGISMANTLVLAISASLGSFLPILILAPERLAQPQGRFIMLGTFVALVGMACCGYAGVLRERDDKAGPITTREMVGVARPFAVGLLLCTGAGVLSALFNVGYSLSQGIIATAVAAGRSAFAGSNLIWWLVLAGGAVTNLCFCAYLFRKNSTWPKFRQAGALPLYGLAVLMGLLWGGSIFVYGSAAPKLGKLGPAIGWPLSLSVGLLTANFAGIVAGEWKFALPTARRWMMIGLGVLLGAIGILGWSGTRG